MILDVPAETANNLGVWTRFQHAYDSNVARGEKPSESCEVRAACLPGLAPGRAERRPCDESALRNLGPPGAALRMQRRRLPALLGPRARSEHPERLGHGGFSSKRRASRTRTSGR